MVWLTVANPDPVQESINVPWVQAEFYDDSVDGAKLGHTYKVLIHLGTLENYSFASHVNQPRPRTYEWRLGMLDGEDFRAPTLDERRCSRHLPPESSSRPLNLGGEQAVDPVGTLPKADTDFQGRLEDFLAEISTALPQALLPTPPKVHGTRRRKSPPVTSRRSARLASKNPEGAKTSSLALKVLVKKLGLTDPPYASDSQKIASLFKQQLTPAAVHSIRELVSGVDGQDSLMIKAVGSAAAPGRAGGN
ncbi:hypothetical protein GUJ93_ZPchr0003g17153 [Zizania palustris]|uniref:Uncharacterized protein n=1 Tax=Zizania palustris TaxID=103762 RepID=A0A8J5VDA3_ZIZPA|nr:hypothetical protein GUJ93_ZPchr0003g17153 [Zizania palustris]